MEKLPELTENLKLKTKNLRSKIFVLCSLFYVLCSASLGSVHAQEQVEIPGPDLKEASFIKVEDLNIGDVVFVKNETGELVLTTITKLEYQQETVEVYNLTVDGEQTFFANDFAVHNKGEGPHDAVCDLALAPKLFTAQTETWRIGDTGTWLDGEGNFKGLFRWDNGMGPSGNGFHEQAGDKICLWGTPVGSCQYPAWEENNPCRNCKQNCGTACACSKTPGCNPTCEMTCGLGVSFLWLNEGPGHEAGPDRIRFRSGYTICDGCGCGRAIKVTAPSGYIIKSITADIKSRMHSSADPKIDGHLYFSRGMNYELYCGMQPRGVHSAVPNWYDGRPTIGFGGGTKYFFIYHRVTSAGVDEPHSVGVDLRDNWAELSNIALEVVKIGEVKGNEVTVINNSLLRYDGVNIDYPEQGNRWPTNLMGEILISNNQVDWTPFTIAANWIIDWTLPQGGEGTKTVYAKIPGIHGGLSATCPMTIYYRPPAGKITGKVYRAGEIGECNTTNAVDDNWTVTCDGIPAKKEADGVTFTCCTDASCTDFQLPYDNYDIELTAPVGWKKADCTGTWSGEGPYTVSIPLEEANWVIDPMYLWQGFGRWFQTQGGDVYAEGSISSQIPPSPSPDPYFSLRINDLEKTAGVVTSEGSRDFAAGEGEGTVSLDGWQGTEDSALFSEGRGKYDHDYYKDLLSGETMSIDEELTSLDEETGNYRSTGLVVEDSDSELVGTLTVSGGKKLVYLVDGNLQVNDNVEVVPGSFLTIIISGGMTIDSGVTRVDGAYFVDGTISTGTVGGDTADSQLALNGTFVGYGGFALQRDLKLDNETTPSHLFTWRPDLLISAPDGLFSKTFTWKQVAPEGNP